MATMIERLDKWLAENRPEYYQQLNPGLTDEEISDLEVSCRGRKRGATAE